MRHDLVRLFCCLVVVMLALLIGLWGRIRGWVIAIGAAVVAVAGIYFAGHRSGRDSAAADAAQADTQARKVRDDATIETDGLDDDAIRALAYKRLRDSQKR